MKSKLIRFSVIIVVLFSIAWGCTDNQMARTYGGKETISLPAGQKLVMATWKEAELWYVTEPMPEGYVPTTKTFREKSQYGVMEGEVIFVESR
jgi:hypothetical protein